jgi:hypothetical protein
MQMYFAGTGLVAVDDILGDFLRRERILASCRYFLSHVADGCHGNNNLSGHSFLIFLFDLSYLGRWVLN